jgi:hypothetical protein
MQIIHTNYSLSKIARDCEHDDDDDDDDDDKKTSSLDRVGRRRRTKMLSGINC